MWMLATVFRALAVAGARGDGTARARVRTRRGLWLVCHASCLRGPDGSLERVAVVIEPAKAAEIAPIIVQAYDLTDRERQITRLIARGAATGEIAEELFLSTHTVRDHVKAIVSADFHAANWTPIGCRGPTLHPFPGNGSDPDRPTGTRHSR
jgi:hypothetical protein